MLALFYMTVRSILYVLSSLSICYKHLSGEVMRLGIVSEKVVKVSVAQLCLILGDLMDCCPPGSSVHGILQARRLEWVAIHFSGDLPNPGTEPGSPTLQTSVQ